MIAWLVSTLPATTAAGATGASIEPGGITMSMGFKQPSFIGMSSSTRQRKHVEHGGARDAGRRVEVRRLNWARPGEIDTRATRLAVDRDRDFDGRPVVHLAAEFPIPQSRNCAGDAFGGVILHMAHVGGNDAGAEFAP